MEYILLLALVYIIPKSYHSCKISDYTSPLLIGFIYKLINREIYHVYTQLFTGRNRPIPA